MTDFTLTLLAVLLYLAIGVLAGRYILRVDKDRELAQLTIFIWPAILVGRFGNFLLHL